MLFTSFNFLIFFLLTTIIYYILPNRFRWILILTASLVFYLFSVPVYILVIIGSVILNYFFGIWIDRCESSQKRKKVMITGVVINLVLLGMFRYASSLSSVITFLSSLPRGNDPVLQKIIVPLGISFFTFTNISYLIEVNRRTVKVEKHLGYFACYISFFPKLIQGPIEKPQHFLPQLHEEHFFDYNKLANGIRLMLWGFFKKLVIADQLSLVVNSVYDDKLRWYAPLLGIATLLYAFQIYMDFSGYIDIARGAGRVLGFNLSRNFRNPYLSGSIKDFWSRWHITLSQWLRDYVFLPLAYFLSRHMKKEKYAGISTDSYIYSISITVTFLLCGLWHGVGWNFIAWGGLFAFYLVIGSLTRKPKRRFYSLTGIINYKKSYNGFQVLITFLLVCFAWIFFRAPNLYSALQIISNLFTGWGHESLDTSIWALQNILNHQGITLTDSVLILLLIPSVIITEQYFQKHPSDFLFKFPVVVRWGIYYGLVLLICYFGRAEINTFVYFQF